jgi:hypothetical protein
LSTERCACLQKDLDEAVYPVEGLTNILSWSPGWLDFDVRYLEAWGGRLGLEVKNGNWWLWLTSIYLHQNLQHILANMLLFLVLASHLELTYGWWRLTLVWLISGVLLPSYRDNVITYTTRAGASRNLECLPLEFVVELPEHTSLQSKMQSMSPHTVVSWKLLPLMVPLCHQLCS